MQHASLQLFVYSILLPCHHHPPRSDHLQRKNRPQAEPIVPTSSFSHSPHGKPVRHSTSELLFLPNGYTLSRMSSSYIQRSQPTALFGRLYFQFPLGNPSCSPIIIAENRYEAPSPYLPQHVSSLPLYAMQPNHASPSPADRPTEPNRPAIHPTTMPSLMHSKQRPSAAGNQKRTRKNEQDQTGDQTRPDQAPIFNLLPSP